MKAATSQALAAPLRILMVIDNCYPALGGAEIQVRTLCRALHARGHRVEVVSYLRAQAMPQRDVVDEAPVFRIAYPQVRLLGGVILCVKLAAFLLRRRNRYDAVHIHIAHNLAAVVGALQPWLGAFTLVKVSGAGEFQHGVLDPSLRTRPVTRLRNALIRRLDAVQAISQHTREQLLGAGYRDERIRMIPNAVDTTRFRPAVVPGDEPAIPTVIYVGRLERVKGVDVLLHAWALVLKQTKARLLVVGCGSLRPELERLVSEFGLGESVKFRFDVTDPSSLLRQADVYVQPSRQEGLANAVLEAMASGLPIVATRVSGSVDLVRDGENGILVATEDPPALAHAICNMLGAGLERRLRMGALSREIVEGRFGTDAVVRSLENAYASRKQSRPAPIPVPQTGRAVEP